MKKGLFVLLFFSSFSFANAQSWLWGQQGTTTSDTYGIATDNKGNAYITGIFPNTISFGIDTLFSATDDSYIVKYDSSGSLKWVKQSNSTASGNCQAIFVSTDFSGNPYIVGGFVSSTTFDTVTLNGVSASRQNVFLTKYNPNGKVLWAKQSVTSSALSSGLACSVSNDRANNVYITGYFAGDISFGTYNLTSPANSFSCFLVKYDSNGNVIWAKQAIIPSGQSSSFGNSITVDDYGNIYVTGDFVDTVVFATKMLQGNSLGRENEFLVKYDIDGNLVWASQSVVNGGKNTPGFCLGWAVNTDASANVYVTGYFYDTVYFSTNRLQSSYGYDDAFIAKYSSNGDVIWVKQTRQFNRGISGAGMAGYSVAIVRNRIFFSGSSGDSSIYDKDTILNLPDGDGSFILELDTTGNLIHSIIVPVGGDDNNAFVCSSDGKYAYFGGDLDWYYVFNKDSLSNSSFSGEPPFIARLGQLDIPPSAIDSSLEYQTGCIFVPNAFSPNGDGQNDVLYVKGACIKTMDFAIFDRWGNMVFESQNISTGWDGTYKGKPMNSGNFVYYITGTLYDGTTFKKQGSVALVR